MKPGNIAVRQESCVGCLRCQLICSQSYRSEFNPLKAWIVIQRTGSGYDYRIDFSDDCTSCGLCAENCAFGALELS